MWVKRVVDRVAGWMQSIEESFAHDAVLLNVRRTVQVTDHTCGSESAFMILRFHRKARSIEAVRRAARTNEEGTSTKALLTLFRRRGLKPVINARATLEDLCRAIDSQAPALVSMDGGGHFAIAFGYSETKIFLADPSIRRSVRVRLRRDVFVRRWDGWQMAVHRRS